MDDTQSHNKEKKSNLVESLDDIFKDVGEFGRCQILLLVLIALTQIISSLTAYSYVFTGAIPDFRCKIPSLPNDTYEIYSEYQRKLVDFYIPFKNNDSTKYDTCHIKKYESNSANLNFTLVKCDKWVYSKKYFEETVSTKVIFLSFALNLNLYFSWIII